MVQWLDSLSDDWVSQPRSSTPGSAIRSPPGLDDSSHISNASQSRIPRYKHPSASIPPKDSMTSSRHRSSNSTDRNLKAVLGEKTLSSINAPLKKNALSGSVKLNTQNTGSMNANRRHASTGTISSVQYDTVQHKALQASPVKGQSEDAVPDWKKRVLQGNKASREQVDLFSPIGLESVFRRPNPETKRQEKKGRKPELSIPEDYPSSPPSYPSSMKQEPEAFSSRKRKGQFPVYTNMEVLEEEEDESSQGAQESNKAPTSSEKEFESKNTQNGSAHNVSSKSGGPEENRNEKISPVFVSRHSTVGGRIDYAAIDASMHQLRSDMDRLGIQQHNRHSFASSDHSIDYGALESQEDSPNPDLRSNDLTCQSLPEDLTTGTEALDSRGAFVNLHRGGYSNEGSFQIRPLSPSSLPAFDGDDLESPVASSSDSRRRLESPETRHANVGPEMLTELPTTPKTNKSPSASSPERTRSSGSPLKLFDKYDTFTNDRLIRRMSQFEESFHCSEDNDSDDHDDFRDTKDSQWPESVQRTSPQRRRKSPPSSPPRFTSRMSSFGEGKLDGHYFRHRQLAESNLPLETEDDVETSPQLPDARSSVFGPQRTKATAPLNFHEAGKRITNEIPSTRTRNSQLTRRNCLEDNEDLKSSLVASKHRPVSHDQTEVLHTKHGKRLPYSPAKDPQPKRRRTLLGPDDVIRQVDQEIEAQPRPMQSIIGRKRQDIDHGSGNQAADPKVIAMRRILRPRTPTPSQTGFLGSYETRVVAEKVHKDPIEIQGGEKQLFLDQKPLSSVDPPTRILAADLANFALDVAQDVTYGTRKTSVTTADFFNEAQQIMRHIRAQGRPQSSRFSVEEPEVENLDKGGNLSPEESTVDEFSRPPSRTGTSLRGLSKPTPLDARVVSHLRKFEESDDPGIALSSSLKSIQINQLKIATMTSEMHDGQQQQDSETESDPPNIRIFDNPSQTQKIRFSASEHAVPDLLADFKVQSLNTQSSSDPSTGRSIPTGSSHSSRNKAVIAPETVSHLISDQVAGMTFDRERQLWVKRKSSSKSDTHNRTPSEATEADLLGEIPDLSVDELEELKRIQNPVASIKVVGSKVDGVSIVDQALQSRLRSTAHSQTELHANAIAKAAIDKFANTIDKSCERDLVKGVVTNEFSKLNATTTASDAGFPGKGQAEEVEHEISILEGRMSRTPTRSSHNKRQARVVTVAFSSPLIDRMQSPYQHDGEYELWEEHSEDDMNEPFDTVGRQWKTSERSRKASFGLKRRPGSSGASRRTSNTNQTYVARPMSRVDEQDELSPFRLLNSVQSQGMDVALSTPFPSRTFAGNSSLAQYATVGQEPSIGFQLSPLSDFTVNQIDKALTPDREAIARRDSMMSSQNPGRSFPIAVGDIVKKLTDVAPHEPYWDDIRRIDLQKKQLLTLHKLDEFCGRIVELDVSENGIGQLDGAPSSIRHLTIRRNCLSDLTAWGHLRNLQYINASSNQIHSLMGFHNLFHLRELIADDNQVEDLNGIHELDGLLSLRLRRNMVRIVDFEGFNLKRLTSLDLHGNKLVIVGGLYQLPALKHLVLSDNQLEMLDLSSQAPIPTLETLDISGNNLRTLDVSGLPNLQVLKFEKNNIPRIHGLQHLKHIHTLSWREQTLSQTSEFPQIQYQECLDVHNLHLSGNIIPTFAPSTDFFNLRHLELASTGLQTLPPDFGLKMPSLRFLNLNYNALHDLRPLLGITRLNQLHLAGNRISRLRRTTSVLARLAKELHHLDLRQNPLTTGFYTPHSDSQRNKNYETSLILPTNEEEPDPPDLSKYLLPPLNQDADSRSRVRLDEPTKLRRRVYEMLTLSSCKLLRRLDGLDVDRRTVARRDGVWKRLVELEVLRGRDV